MLRRLINNVRRGFATNSSSSHSLVYFKQPVADQRTSYGDNEFGWGDFTLSSLGDKLMYVLTTAIGSHYWTGEVPAEEVDENYKRYGSLFPEFNKKDFEYAMRGYVDHQSLGQVAELLPLARDPHVVIYGGNDNDGTGLNDTLGSAGERAEWGSYTDRTYNRVTPDQLEDDDYRWRY